MNFSKKYGGTVRKVIAFEPDENNKRGLIRNFGNDSRVTIIDKGLSDHEKTLYFFSDGSMGYFLSDNEQVDDTSNCVKIPCVGIDEIAECKDTTFIKMDIEGSEMEALKGAQETIKRNHPKLAICIYHSLEDMVRIAEFIHEKFPYYKLYVRQHTADWSETVLYAVV